MAKKALLFVCQVLSTWCESISGIALMGVMVLTGCDIVGRSLGHPIPGTYEIVSFAGGLVVGMAMPVTSRARAHVMVDIITSRLSHGAGRILYVCTRFLNILMFLLLGYSTLKLAYSFQTSGEVTPTLSLPFYYIAYAVAGACLVECIILVGDMFVTGGETNE